MVEMYDPRFDELPLNPVEYPHRLAHDLAWGVHHRKWVDQFAIKEQPYGNPWTFVTNDTEENLKYYLDTCWGDRLPDVKILDRYEYIIKLGSGSSDGTPYELTEKALLLPEKKPSVPIFISYARAQSSAFALLLVARFKEQNMSPFLDMHPDREELPLGSDWEATIKMRVTNSNAVIVIVGPKTLLSKNVIKELNWAKEYGKKIIPIWHRINEPPEYSDSLTEEMKLLTNSKQGVVVESENPKQYNAALDQLLAHFNIAP